MLKTRSGLPLLVVFLLLAGSARAQVPAWGDAAAAGAEKIGLIRSALRDAATVVEGKLAPGKTDELFDASDEGGFSLGLSFDEQATLTLFRCRKGNNDDICDDVQFVFPQLAVDRKDGVLRLDGREFARLNDKRGFDIVLPEAARLVAEVTAADGAGAVRTTTVYKQSEAFEPVSYEPGKPIQYEKYYKFSPVSAATVRVPAGEAGALPRLRVRLELEPK